MKKSKFTDAQVVAALREYASETTATSSARPLRSRVKVPCDNARVTSRR